MCRDGQGLAEARTKLRRLVLETIAILPVDALLWVSPSTHDAIPYVRLLRLVQAYRLVRFLRRLLISVRVSYSYGQFIFAVVLFFWVTHWLACFILAPSSLSRSQPAVSALEQPAHM